MNKKKDFILRSTYEVSEVYEFSVDYDSCNYLIIYGMHINGWFISILNHRICTEAAEPEDVLYNTEKLITAGMDPGIAENLAKAVHIHYQLIQTLD